MILKHFEADQKSQILEVFKSFLREQDVWYHDSEGNNIFHWMAESLTFSDSRFIQAAWGHVKEWSRQLKEVLISRVPVAPLTETIICYLGSGECLLSAQNSSLQAPIHLAAKNLNNPPEIINLLKSGVDLTLKDNGGRTVQKALENWELGRQLFGKSVEEVPEH